MGSAALDSAAVISPLICDLSLNSSFESNFTSFLVSTGFKCVFEMGLAAYNCLAILGLEGPLLDEVDAGMSFGGVISFIEVIVSLDFKNSSSSSVAHAELMGAEPYLSSVVIMCCFLGFFLGDASGIEEFTELTLLMLGTALTRGGIDIAIFDGIVTTLADVRTGGSFCCCCSIIAFGVVVTVGIEVTLGGGGLLTSAVIL